MKKYTHYLFFCLILISFTQYSAYAQVTIGTNLNPKSGALLDLKENDNNSGGVTASKGMMLPRVHLTSRTSLLPMLKDNDNYMNDPTEKEKQDKLHTGLWVYNTNICLESDASSAGPFIWSGKQWTSLSSKKVVALNSGIVTNIDQNGNPFYSANFGNEGGEWMLSNLAATTFDTQSPLAGEELTTPLDGSLSGLENMLWGYPNINGESLSSSSTYMTQPNMGLLYNYLAANGILANQIAQGNEGEGEANEQARGAQGICPDGWHIPSDKEWNILQKEIYSNPQLYSSLSATNTWDNAWNTTVGQQSSLAEAFLAACKPILLGEKSTYGVSFVPEQGGLSILTTGKGTNNGNTNSNFGENAYFWTASTKAANNTNSTAYTRNFSGVDNGIYRSIENVVSDLMSVRCKRDGHVDFASCGDNITDSEGNIYTTAQFGGQCWLTQNMRATGGHTVDGDNIAQPTVGTSTVQEYGLLYSWEAATGNVGNSENEYSEILMPNEFGTSSGTKIQGICPIGWHIPSDYEWAVLEKEIALNPSTYSTSGDTGITLSDNIVNVLEAWRPDTGQGWGEYMLAPNVYQPDNAGSGSSKRNTNGGFMAFLSGGLNYNETSQDNVLGDKANFWSSSATFTVVGNTYSSRYRTLHAADSKTYRGSADINSKMSVRCILD